MVLDFTVLVGWRKAKVMTLYMKTAFKYTEFYLIKTNKMEIILH